MGDVVSGPERFEPEIWAYEQRDQLCRPRRGAVLFTGSSTIRRWATLQTDFPFAQVVNRGFGGSDMSDVVHFADRVITPYEVRLVVVYAGDNDIGRNKPPECVLRDAHHLVAKVRAARPGQPMAFVSIKPSPLRWPLADHLRRANTLLRAFTAETPGLAFVDLFDSMLGSDGAPRAELYAEDRLHLSLAGYEVWREAVTPLLLSFYAAGEANAAGS